MATKTTVNLFEIGTKVKETAKKVADKKIVKVVELEDKIQRFLTLKAEIEAATGEIKMLEGDIKIAGKESFLQQYQQQKSTPENFKLQDATGALCMFICMDKYTVVDADKAEILEAYDGLVSENVVYKVNADLVGQYGAVLSKLIIGCKDIKEEDKAQLITGEKTFTIAKGSIDRLMQYDNPAEIFELMNPILMLKK